jgi:hypothetical protein
MMRDDFAAYVVSQCAVLQPAFFGIAVFAFCVVGLPLEGQSIGPKPVLDTLPVWSSGIRTFADLRGRYVFRDSETQEVVIAFRSEENPASVMTIYRYRPQNQVQATVTATVAMETRGTYRYRYVIGNGRNARLAISLWLLVGPNSSGDVQADGSSWAFARLRNQDTKQAAIETAPRGTALSWAAGGTGSPVQPGAASPVFDVLSSFLPGLTSAYFQGGDGLATSGGDLPLEVSARVEPFMVIDQRFQVQLTIGPKIRSDARETGDCRSMAASTRRNPEIARNR